MPQVKLDYSKPETFLAALKALDLPEGGLIELERVDEGVLMKTVGTVDSFDIPREDLPEAPSYEERMRVFTSLQGNATDDREDIDVDFIAASRVNRTSTASEVD